MVYFALNLVTAGVLCLTACCGANSQPEGLETLLPDRVGDWARHQAVLMYAGDDLFTYINGGAEIYQEFGFVRVVVQDYKSSGGGTISLEIYEMADPESSYGMYTFKRSPQGESFDVPGGEARLEDYYLNLWKGEYLVTLTGFDQTEATILGLKALARDVEQRIAVTSPAPELVKRLPEEQLVEGSVKYFMGPLALFNSHRFAAENLFAPERGVRGDYGEGDSVFIFRYATPGTAQDIFKKVKSFYSLNPDPNIQVKLAQPFILAALGQENLDRAEFLLQRVRLNF
jgi:hypothetical protein